MVPDGGCALVNTTLERQKGRNLRGNQKVSLLVVDPGNTSRFIQPIAAEDVASALADVAGPGPSTRAAYAQSQCC